MKNLKASLLVCSVLLTAQAAIAQAEPAGLSQQAPATSGANDVYQEGFQKAEPAPEKVTDSTTFLLSAGGLFTSGNSRMLSLTGAGNLKIRRDIHQFTTIAAANYGRAAASKDASVEPTVENYQGRARYDVFLVEQLAAFLQLSARRDRFQGLLIRLNIDPGLAYYFIDGAKHQFWGELGYDLQYDVRRDDSRVDETTNIRLDKTATRHNARGFVGYDNKLNESVSFATGLEYLQGLAPFEDDNSGDINWRMNWDAGLTSKVNKSLSIATTFSVKFDNNPLPGLAKTDTVTAVNLVYDLL